MSPRYGFGTAATSPTVAVDAVPGTTVAAFAEMLVSCDGKLITLSDFEKAVSP